MTDDLSWWTCTSDDGWVGRHEIPTTTIALLHEIGRTDAPFKIANAEALRLRVDEMVCEIDRQEDRQKPFAYRANGSSGWANTTPHRARAIP